MFLILFLGLDFWCPFRINLIAEIYHHPHINFTTISFFAFLPFNLSLHNFVNIYNYVMVQYRTTAHYTLIRNVQCAIYDMWS